MQSPRLTIGVITPSRERSGKAKTQMASFTSRAEDPRRIQFLYYIDEDDKQIDDYRKLTNKSNATLLVGKPNKVSEGFNRLAIEAQSNGCDIILMGNDDAHCTTAQWDTKLEQVFLKAGKNRPMCVLLGGNSREVFAFPAVSDEWITRVEHYSPGFFKFFFHDKWIFDISTRAGCVEYAKDIKIEHMHMSRTRYMFSRDKTHYRNNGRKVHRIIMRIFGIQTGDCGKMREDSRIFESTIDLRVAAAKRLTGQEEHLRTPQVEST